jgi:hypothetical protein
MGAACSSGGVDLNLTIELNFLSQPYFQLLTLPALGSDAAAALDCRRQRLAGPGTQGKRAGQHVPAQHLLIETAQVNCCRCPPARQ